MTFVTKDISEKEILIYIWEKNMEKTNPSNKEKKERTIVQIQLEDIRNFYCFGFLQKRMFLYLLLQLQHKICYD